VATIEEKRRHREAFIEALYDLTDGDSKLAMVSRDDVCRAAGLTEEDGEAAAMWLVGRYFAEWRAMGGGGGLIGITELGVDAVEESRSPTQPPAAPPGAQVVQILGDMIGSQIQLASGEAQQKITGGLDQPDSVAQIRQIIDLVITGLDQAEDLSAEDRADIEEDVELLRREIEEPKPKRTALRRSLLSLGRMAEALPPAVAVALAEHFHVLGL
jgi:hypothetical protein